MKRPGEVLGDRELGPGKVEHRYHSLRNWVSVNSASQLTLSLNDRNSHLQKSHFTEAKGFVQRLHEKQPVANIVDLIYL